MDAPAAGMNSERDRDDEENSLHSWPETPIIIDDECVNIYRVDDEHYGRLIRQINDSNDVDGLQKLILFAFPTENRERWAEMGDCIGKSTVMRWLQVDSHEAGVTNIRQWGNQGYKGEKYHSARPSSKGESHSSYLVMFTSISMLLVFDFMLTSSSKARGLLGEIHPRHGHEQVFADARVHGLRFRRAPVCTSSYIFR